VTAGRETDVLVQAEDLVVERFDDGVVLWAPSTETLHRLDLQGTAVWDLLDGQRSLQDIATELAEVFQVDRAIILPDVVTYTSQLRTLSLAIPARRQPGSDQTTEQPPH
jgi:hypothetical protein